MRFHDQVAEFIPSLRRYAHAVTGRPSVADHYLAELLQEIIADRTPVRADAGGMQIDLFRALSRLIGRGDSRRQATPCGVRSIEDALQNHLQRLWPRQQQAVVLRYLEGFGGAAIAEILDCRTADAEKLIEAGVATLAETPDDPLFCATVLADAPARKASQLAN